MNKFRHEFKYPISNGQLEVLKVRLNGLLELDKHVNGKGIYNIRSLYFDDYYNRCFYENENGTDPREKFRIRIYNHSSERITLECKRKERGKTYKSSCSLTIEQAKMLISGKIPEGGMHPLLAKLVNEMKTRQMKPVVIVEYDRIPYVYKIGNVRVTFDTNIASSGDISKFLEPTISKRPVMPYGMQLLEVKWDELLPDFIYKILNLENLRQTAFSKYYLCRKYYLKGK